MDQHAPLRAIRLNRNTDIIDQKLERAKKRRKRIRKKYNKENNPDSKIRMANEVTRLNKYIKNRINAARKNQIMTRLEGKNVKTFWNTIAELEGKKSREEILLELDSGPTSDPQLLSEAFADFFSSKVEKLSNNHGQDSYKTGPSDLVFTADEIRIAIKGLKTKLCHGEDGIPMRLVKDFAVRNIGTVQHFFNQIPTQGIPQSWKNAIITPLFKAGDKHSTLNYRPISNLDSLGKLFERVILNRMNLLGELDGKFQHGFKHGRSTTTAMLELQDFVSVGLDSGNLVGTYSIDLSAAFDLLRPEVLYDTIKDVFPKGLLNIVMDFLSQRTFQVEIKSNRSTPRKLKVGCVQGSILGPRLFTLYMRNLHKILPPELKSNLIAYADDTYVSIAHNNIQELKANMERVMTFHDDSYSYLYI